FVGRKIAASGDDDSRFGEFGIGPNSAADRVAVGAGHQKVAKHHGRAGFFDQGQADFAVFGVENRPAFGFQCVAENMPDDAVVIYHDNSLLRVGWRLEHKFGPLNRDREGLFSYSYKNSR